MARSNPVSPPVKSINGVTHYKLLSGKTTFQTHYQLTSTTVKCDYYEVNRRYCREFAGSIGTCIPIKYAGKDMYQFMDLYDNRLCIIECISTYRDYIKKTTLNTKYVVCPNVIFLLHLVRKYKIPKTVKNKILLEYQNVFQLIC